MIEAEFWHFCHDPITRYLTLKHKKPWQRKLLNKRLASNGLRIRK